MSVEYIYRVYDDDGRLIYLGRTQNLVLRLRTHAISSWWAPQVAKVKAHICRGAWSATDEERRAILSEHPRWNLNGLPLARHWSKDQYHDWFTSFLNLRPAEEMTPRNLLRLGAVRRQYRNKFNEELPIELPTGVAA